MTTDKPLESVCLENRCKLDIYDNSTKMAADRWKVSLVARLTVPVEERFIQGGTEMPAALDDIRQVLGAEAVFEMKKERVFVDDGQKAPVLDELLRDLKKDSLPYLARPSFPAKFVAKRYREKISNRP